MRIVYLIPGSGDMFYCQNCMRDQMLVKELRRLGHDVIAVPIYLPLSSSDFNQNAAIFFGAINFYLKEKFPLLKNLPSWLEKRLNSPGVLKWASRKAGSTKPKGNEAMTFTMLRGEMPNQAREMEKLLSWLKQEIRPDLVHLSNALIIGFAKIMKQELSIPVFCSLQDEDTWLNAMEPRFSQTGWQEMKQNAVWVDRFIPVSNYYSRLMQNRLQLPAAKFHPVYVGIKLDDYQPGPPVWDPPVIGYLSRLSPVCGLDILVEAFLILKKDPRFIHLKLKAAGGATGDDLRFVREIKRRLLKQRVADDVELNLKYDSESHYDFLRSLSVLSVPVPGGEAFGIYLLEALAAGVPVVQPEQGAFPEIIDATGGGICYRPNRAGALAKALAELLLSPERARSLSQKGREAVSKHFQITNMATRMVAVYQGYINPATRPKFNRLDTFDRRENEEWTDGKSVVIP